MAASFVARDGITGVQFVSDRWVALDGIHTIAK